MSKKNKKNQNDEVKAKLQEEIQDQEELNIEQQADENEKTENEDPAKKIAELEKQLEEQKKEYLYK